MQNRLLHTVLGLSAFTVVSLTLSSAVKAQQQGMASWYGPGFSGNPTASGEVFNPQNMTAAHHSLPFGTQVRVTNLDNGRSVVVRVNDRLGHASRVIDLSTAAAQVLGIVNSGIAPVRLDVLGR
jgi:rare lipoprotein A